MGLDLVSIISKFAKDNNLTDVNLEVVAKELFHYEILKELYGNDDLSDKIVFQGETSLRLCYGNNRFSEDLDFAINKGSKFNNELMASFERFFVKRIQEKYGVAVGIKLPKKPTNSEGITINAWLVKVDLPAALVERVGTKSKIKIEIAEVPSYNNTIRSINENYEGVFGKNDGTVVRVETKDEILADKIVALVARPYLKYRDMWDIDFLRNNATAINYSLIEKKIEDYKLSDNFMELLSDAQTRLKNEATVDGFKSEMSRFLMPQMAKAIQQEDGVFFDIKRCCLNELDRLEYHLNEKNDLHINL